MRWRVAPLVGLVVCAELVACSDSKDAGEPPSECLSQCPLGSNCEVRRLDQYPDYDATLDEWSLPDSCMGLLFAVEGTCANGIRFIERGNGHTTQLFYFGANGTFLGLTTGTDDADPTCQGRSYWPEAVVCTNATVRTVLCGESWAEGDRIDVPFADGVHP